MHDSCPMAGQEGEDIPDLGPDSRGAGLVISTVIVFLLPLASGIGGATLATRWTDGASVDALGQYEAAGLVGGLLIGVILAKLLIGWRLRHREACPVGGAVNHG